jgi:hypothetical protein
MPAVLRDLVLTQLDVLASHEVVKIGVKMRKEKSENVLRGMLCLAQLRWH